MAKLTRRLKFKELSDEVQEDIKLDTFSEMVTGGEVPSNAQMDDYEDMLLDRINFNFRGVITY